MVEGAGATGFAAVLQGLLPELKGKKVVIPVCGGNIVILVDYSYKLSLTKLFLI